MGVRRFSGTFAANIRGESSVFLSVEHNIVDPARLAPLRCGYSARPFFTSMIGTVGMGDDEWSLVTRRSTWLGETGEHGFEGGLVGADERFGIWD